MSELTTGGDDLISRKWILECVKEGWIKFETEKDKNTFIHLVRDIAPSAGMKAESGFLPGKGMVWVN